MKREAELRRLLRSREELRDAVGAMKSLSAHHFREARRAVEPAGAYRRGVERMLAWAAAGLRGGEGGAGLLVIGAELGLCGSYNAQIVQAAQRRRAALGEGPTFCVGRRATRMLGRAGVEVDRAYAGAAGVQGITALLLELGADMLTTFAEQSLSRFEILSSRFEGVGHTAPTSVELLPIAPPEADEPRAPRYVGAEAFAEAAVREYLFIMLYDLILGALASENGARLAATQGAERWLDERSDVLRRQLTSIRRENSTQEVLEIVAGSRGLRARSLE